MATQWTGQFKHPIDYLLKEDGGFLLQESGFKLVLEQTGTANTAWSLQAKN